MRGLEREKLTRGMRHGFPIAVSMLVLTLCVLPPVAGSAPSQVRPLDTTPPLADAGPDQIVAEDVPVVFDGSASTDDVGIAGYRWVFSDPVGSSWTAFSVSGGAVEAEFDPIRPYLYALSTQELRVFNLSSGALERTFPIVKQAVHPMSLDIAPQGTYLAVGIPTGERGYYHFGPYSGYFASFDLVNQAKIGEFHVDEDVADVLATSDGFVIVSGGSGQWADVRLFSAWDGTQSGQGGTIWQYARIAMHPSESRIYSAEITGIYPQSIARYDFNSPEGFTSWIHWPYHGGDPGGNVWASPRGDALVTGSGYVLSSVQDSAQDMRSIGRLTTGGISAVAFDVETNLMVVAGGQALQFFDMDSFELLGTRHLDGSPTAVAIRAGLAYALVGDAVIAFTLPRLTLYGVSPSHTFAQPGEYVVTLTVWDDAGNEDTDTMTVTVRDATPPAANAGPDRTVWVGEGTWFDGSASSDNVGVVDYLWTFVDGEPVTLHGSSVYHTFRYAGTAVVTLIVEDAAGQSDEDTASVEVLADTVPPIANAGSDRDIFPGEVVYFDGQGSTDNRWIASYLWTFTEAGNPVVLNGSTAYYRFDNPGTFIVTLTVSDAAGNNDTDTMSVNVIPDITPPVADAGNDQTIDVGGYAYFSGWGSTDDRWVTDYVWTFTDGGDLVVLYGPNAYYRFANPGTFVVTLTVADPAGNSDTDTTNVYVVADRTPPVAEAGPDQTISKGDFAHFDGRGSTDNRGIVSLAWTFTVGGSPFSLLGPVVSYRFDHAGTFLVTLTVTDVDGNSDTDTTTVLVLGPPVTNGSVEMLVVDDKGLPLAGMIVRIYEGATVVGSAVTDATGRAAVRDLAPGTYDVLASAPGFRGGAGLVAVIEGRSSVVTLILSPIPVPVQVPTTGSIRGVVTSAEGSPVAGATVRVSDGAREVSNTTTEGDGLFQFSGLPPLAYAVRVEAAGFSSAVSLVATVAGETTLMTVALERTPTPPETAGPGPSIDVVAVSIAAVALAVALVVFVRGRRKPAIAGADGSKGEA